MRGKISTVFKGAGGREFEGGRKSHWIRLEGTGGKGADIFPAGKDFSMFQDGDKVIVEVNITNKTKNGITVREVYVNGVELDMNSEEAAS